MVIIIIIIFYFSKQFCRLIVSIILRLKCFNYEILLLIVFPLKIFLDKFLKINK